MPLLKTASHDTACESVASLTFFFPLSSFARHQIYFSLDLQILQFSCNDLFFSPLPACGVSSRQERTPLSALNSSLSFTSVALGS